MITYLVSFERCRKETLRVKNIEKNGILFGQGIKVSTLNRNTWPCTHVFMGPGYPFVYHYT